MQRDRVFEHYQDLELGYQRAAELLGRAHRRLGRGPGRAGRDPDRRTRPTTTSSPTGSRRRPYEPGQEVVISYRMRAVSAIGAMHPGGKA